MPTIDELRVLQALPLDVKIMKTQQRIKEWVNYYGVDGVYVSFSGGKDSTVLLHLVRELYPSVEAVFVNTGLEYPEIQKFVKTLENVTVVRPAMRFDEVIRQYGFPLISKEVADRVQNAKRFIASGGLKYVQHYYELEREIPTRAKQLLGLDEKQFGRRYDFSRYRDLVNVDFNISPYCCNIMKKKPLAKIKKKAILATMADESFLRKNNWLKTGCNAFKGKKQISKPLSFWTQQDVLTYIKQNNIPIASIYGDVVYDNDGEQYHKLLCDCGCRLKTTGLDRTGCIFCGFGAHLEKKGEGRFERLKKTHPRQYEYCLEGGAYDTDGLWKPTKEGLGMKHVFDTVNKIYGKDFIRY